MTSRSIVLTGVTRGIGRALLDRFHEAGHVVAGCGRNADTIASLAETLGAPHLFEALDVSDDEGVRAWAAQVLELHGAPDLLINNAALMNKPAPLWEVSAEEFDQLLAVNISGTANFVRAFVPAMIERGSGVIVNLSSGWGRSTSPEVGPYCATKYAIEGLTGSLAQELPRGLAAVALSPGTVNTDMLQECWGEHAAEHDRPDAWSHAAAEFLLGLGAQNNGQSLSVG